MSYNTFNSNTTFNGSFKLSRKVSIKEQEYINLFSKTKRMKRNVDKLFKLYDGKFGNPFAETSEDIYGNDGEYFVRDDGENGQFYDQSIIHYNLPPGQIYYSNNKYGNNKYGTNDGTNEFLYTVKFIENEELKKNIKCQPSLWCKWIISDDSNFLIWNNDNKFYFYSLDISIIDWLTYLIKHFFEKWGITLNGRVDWQGVLDYDRGIIYIKNNNIKTYSSKNEILQFERKMKIEQIQL